MRTGSLQWSNFCTLLMLLYKYIQREQGSSWVPRRDNGPGFVMMCSKREVLCCRNLHSSLSYTRSSSCSPSMYVIVVPPMKGAFFEKCSSEVPWMMSGSHFLSGEMFCMEMLRYRVLHRGGPIMCIHDVHLRESTTPGAKSSLTVIWPLHGAVYLLFS